MKMAKMDTKKHMKLLQMMKDHFAEDEGMEDEEMARKHVPMEGEEEMGDDEYPSMDREDGEMDEEGMEQEHMPMEDEEEMDEDEHMPKKDRKDLAVMVMAKKLGRRNRR